TQSDAVPRAPKPVPASVGATVPATTPTISRQSPARVVPQRPPASRTLRKTEAPMAGDACFSMAKVVRHEVQLEKVVVTGGSESRAATRAPEPAAATSTRAEFSSPPLPLIVRLDS